MSLNIPVSYDDETRMLSVSEEWAGTTIDDRSTTFIVSGIPEDVKSAKLDVKVAVRSAKGKTVRPFMILKGIESGVGSATVPSALFDACKRDRKFIFQLELMTEFETYASKNWITLKVSDAVFRTPSGMDQWNQDQVLIDAYEVESEGKIVFKRFSGEEFSILLKDNDVEWGVIKNIPWRSTWSTGTPTDKEILTESLVKGALDEKTSIVAAIPEWDEETTFLFRSSVICNGKLFQSKRSNNKGHVPPAEDEEDDWWKAVSSAGGAEQKPTGSVSVWIGDGTSKHFEIVHNFGSFATMVTVWDANTGLYVVPKISSYSETVTELDFNTAPETRQFLVTVFCGQGAIPSMMVPFDTPDDLWVVQHNLGRRPIVQVYDGNGLEVEAMIFNFTAMDLKIGFSEPMTGFVLLV